MEHAGISVRAVKAAVEGASHVAQRSLRLRGLERDCQVTRTVFPTNSDPISGNSPN
mgnify:CR=1 FL=1